MAVEELLEWLDKRIAELEGELSKLRAIREHLMQLSGQQERGAEFTEEDLMALPWRPYQSGMGEWVFADQAPESLVKRLEQEGQIQIGEYVYALRTGSGGKRFVSRRRATNSQQARGKRSRGPQLSPEDLVRASRR